MFYTFHISVCSIKSVISDHFRLNALVGTQSFDVDDNRSDLTDPYKPIKIAEDYRAIVNKEWETAYEELEVVLDEPKILIYLGKVTWVSLV